MELDWKNLAFGFRPTEYNVRCYHRDGKWGELEISSSQYSEHSYFCHLSPLWPGSL